MHTSRHIRKYSFNNTRSAVCPSAGKLAQTGFFSKSLIFLLTVFMICAFAQAVQLNSLLAKSVSVGENISALRAEQELIATKYGYLFQQL